MESPPQQQTLARLVEEARRDGVPDAYRGQRRWTRYRLGKPLEIAADLSLAGGSWQVITHNLSGGGLGFWSRCAFSVNQRLYLRELPTDGYAPWVEARVTYNTLGLHGYLVGVCFETPIEPENSFDFRQTPSDPTADDPPASVRSQSRPHLASSSGLCAAALTAAALASFNMLETVLPFRATAAWVPVALLLLLSSLTGVITWALLRGDARLLRDLKIAIEHLISGMPCKAALRTPATHEIEELRQAVLNIALRLKRQLDFDRERHKALEGMNRLKTNVLSMVSHDLRTPLTSIQMYAHMLTEGMNGLAEADRQEFGTIISEESLRLSRLLDDLLQVQRLEEGKIELNMGTVDLAAIVTAVFKIYKPMADSRQVSLIVEGGENLPPIVADPDKLNQAIGNFVSNALKYTPAGGTIILRTRSSGEEVQVCVSDTGCGIPRHQWDMVFDRFTQLSPPLGEHNRGSGLGLYIVRMIAEAHDGRVWVDSVVDQGSQFVLALPLQHSSRDAIALGSSESPRGHILVCDADPELASGISHLLRRNKFQVTIAHSAQRALELLRDDHPDVFLTDVALPDMPTTEFLAELRSNEFCESALVVHSLDVDHRELRAAGVDVLVRRPASREELLQAIHITMLRRQQKRGIVLLVNTWGMDYDNLSQQLAADNYIPLVAQNVMTAASMLISYPVDFVLVKTGVDNQLSHELREFAADAASRARVGVLVNPQDLTTRVAPAQEGYVYLPYTRGQEAATVAALDSVCVGT